ncbi:hypothetical protein DPMN_102809 [Dreissena polymorpha]|uniref:Uncharacterized protein n=1 Tax=Dreissena polymorpha TaxID=45954 RepID=A0A9D4LK07_DREPO|nr:hypothetical protein DPMN_102809 [Dreissena polymorpha]
MILAWPAGLCTPTPTLCPEQMVRSGCPALWTIHQHPERSHYTSVAEIDPDSHPPGSGMNVTDDTEESHPNDFPAHDISVATRRRNSLANMLFCMVTVDSVANYDFNTGF